MASELSKTAFADLNSDQTDEVIKFGSISKKEADSWHVPIRPNIEIDNLPSGQSSFNIIIKVKFDRGWVDSLPEITINPEDATNTVILNLDTIQEDLDSLISILKLFDSQIIRSRVLLPGFKPLCEGK